MTNGRTAKERFEGLASDDERLWAIFDSLEEVKHSLKKNYITRQQFAIIGLTVLLLCFGANKLPFLLKLIGV